MSRVASAAVFLTANVTGFNRGLGDAERMWNRNVGNIERGARRMVGFIGNASDQLLRLSAVGAGVFIGAGAAVVKTASDFESAFAGVRKTVDATEAEFAVLRRGILDMSNSMPTAAGEIAKVMEIAGQLGVRGVDNLQKFTKVAIMLGDTTNLSAETAATELSRFLNVTGSGIGTIDRLGAAIVDLGNNTATTEAEIVSMAMRLAGAGKSAKLTDSEILALAASLSSVGIEAEMGGSAFSRLILMMVKGAQETGKASEPFQAMAKAAGMTAEKFREMVAADPAKAIQALLNGLGNVQEQGGPIFKMLEDFGVDQIRLTDTMLRSASAAKLFGNNIALSADAYRENIALTIEAEKRYETFKSQLLTMWNNIRNVLVEIGTPMLAPLSNFIKSDLIPTIRELASWVQVNGAAIKDWTEQKLGAAREMLERLYKWIVDNKDQILSIGKAIIDEGPRWITYGIGIGLAGKGLETFGLAALGIVSTIKGLSMATGGLIGAAGAGAFGTTGVVAGGIGILGVAGAIIGLGAVMESFINGPGKGYSNAIQRYIDDNERWRDSIDSVFDGYVAFHEWWSKNGPTSGLNESRNYNTNTAPPFALGPGSTGHFPGGPGDLPPNHQDVAARSAAAPTVNVTINGAGEINEQKALMIADRIGRAVRRGSGR